MKLHESVTKKSFEMKHTHQDFLNALRVVNEYHLQLKQHLKEVEKEMSGISKFAGINKETRLGETKASVKLLNLLHLKFGHTRWNLLLSDLSGTSIKELSQYNGMGNKMIAEFKEMCFYAGVDLLE